MAFSCEKHQQAVNKISRSIDRISEEHAIEASRFHNMAEFGRKRAKQKAELGDYQKAQRWEQWAYHKELEAEYHESKI